MFETEMNLEERSSGVGPLILIATVCLTIVATLVYVTLEARKHMGKDEATRAVTAMLEQRGPAILHFRTGLLKPAVAKASDPRYQVLQRAQVVSIETQENGMKVALTENGAAMINSISGEKHTHNSDGTEEYAVPMASRKLIAITGVKTMSPSASSIFYTWNWAPTSMGQIFDLDGQYAGDLDVWQRDQLARDGADLFHGAAIRDEYEATTGWQMARN